MTREQVFVADDKFGDVIAALAARGGWRRHPHLSFPGFDLKWTNYARIAWQRVRPSQRVNHLEHAVLFSQKHRLAELLYAHSVPTTDTLYPRTVDLAAPDGRQALKQWVVYTRAVVELQQNSKLASFAEAFLTQVLADEGFFKRTPSSPSKIDVDNEAWRALLGGRVRDDCMRARVSASRAREVLDELKKRDPQFSMMNADDQAGGLWICKPANLSQGRGITLVRTWMLLLDAVEGSDQTHWVVQKYIERPLLLQRGRKFDIRQWVLVTALPPAAKAFWHRDCYLRFCSQRFSLDDSIDRFAHLSNYSVQKDFVTDGDADKSFEPMWSSDRFRSWLRETHGTDVWTERVVPSMQRVAKHALLAVLPKLRMVGRGFEWLGFDFLVDDELRVWLLEVNVSPDVSHSTSVTAKLVPRATTELLELVLNDDDEHSPDNGWLPMDLSGDSVEST